MIRQTDRNNNLLTFFCVSCKFIIVISHTFIIYVPRQNQQRVSHTYLLTFRPIHIDQKRNQKSGETLSLTEQILYNEQLFILWKKN